MPLPVRIRVSFRHLALALAAVAIFSNICITSADIFGDLRSTIKSTVKSHAQIYKELLDVDYIDELAFSVRIMLDEHPHFGADSDATRSNRFAAAVWPSTDRFDYHLQESACKARTPNDDCALEPNAVLEPNVKTGCQDAPEVHVMAFWSPSWYTAPGATAFTTERGNSVRILVRKCIEVEGASDLTTLGSCVSEQGEDTATRAALLLNTEFFGFSSSLGGIIELKAGRWNAIFLLQVPIEHHE